MNTKYLSFYLGLSTFFGLNMLSYADIPLPNAQTYSTGIPYRGVSLAGGDFKDDGTGNAPSGKFIPQLKDAALFLYKGMNTYRIPVAWEYLADINGDFLNTSDGQQYLSRLDNIIQTLSKKNATIILDLHNYMRFNPSDISQDYNDHSLDGPDVIGIGSNAPTTQAFQNLWFNLAKRYSGQNLIYGIMNEPHDIDENGNQGGLLLKNENAAIQGIRSAESEHGTQAHLILIDGNNWSGLHSWTGQGLSNGQIPNSTFFPSQIVDSANHYAFDVHQYFDGDSSGTYPSHDCLSLQQFRNGYTYNGQSYPGFDSYWPAFQQWIQQNQPQSPVKVFLGEFGSPDTPNCRADITYYLNLAAQSAYSSQTQSGILGWTVWAAGGYWGDYVNSIAPGGPANSLMWNNALYENYLTPTAAIPPLNRKQAIARLYNNSDVTLNFSSGNLPFQWQGSADLAPHKDVYLYPAQFSSANSNQQVQLTFFPSNNVYNYIGIGVITGSDGHQYGFSYGSVMTPVIPKECDVFTPNQGDHRCFVWSEINKS